MLLAVGDIHGCFTALETLAAVVPFAADDLLITLGDYVDRGPDSRAVVDWLIERWRLGRLVPLRGNHELVMQRARVSKELQTAWLTFGGDATLASYAAPGASGQIENMPMGNTPMENVPMDNVPAEHWKFFEQSCREYYETDTHFFVHANADPELPLECQSEQMLYWEKFDNPLPHVSGKIMVCGHTAQKSGMPNNIGHAVCIDTWVYGDGWLTCLDPATGRFWQANQQRQWRRGELGMPEVRGNPPEGNRPP